MAWTSEVQIEEESFMRAVEDRKGASFPEELAVRNPTAAFDEYFVVQADKNAYENLLDQAETVISKVLKGICSNTQLKESDRSILKGFHENEVGNEKGEAVEGTHGNVAFFSLWLDDQVKTGIQNGVFKELPGLPKELEEVLKKDLASADTALVEAVIFPALEVLAPGNTVVENLRNGKTVSVRVEESGQAPQSFSLKMVSDKTSIASGGNVTEYHINGLPVSAAANGEKNPFQLLQQLFDSFVEKRYETRQWKVEITTV
jgi:hypothetical protein